MHHPKQRRSMFRRLFSAWIALSTLGVGMMIFATGARAATQYDVVNMTVNASSIHVIATQHSRERRKLGASRIVSCGHKGLEVAATLDI